MQYSLVTNYLLVIVFIFVFHNILFHGPIMIMACANSSREKRVGLADADFVQSTANFGPTIRLVSIVIWNDYFSANYIDIARDIVVFTAIFSDLCHNL